MKGIDIVQIGFFKYLMEALELSDSSLAKLLKQVDLHHFDLSNEDHYVPIHGMYQLLELLSYEVGVQEFIEYFNDSIDIQNARSYGDFYLSAPDLLALAQLAENHSSDMISNETDQLTTNGAGSSFSMKLSDQHFPGAELTLRTLLAITVKHIRLACGEDWHPVKIHWPYAEFADFDVLFSAPVEIVLGTERLEIFFQTHILSNSITFSASDPDRDFLSLASNAQKIEKLLDASSKGNVPTISEMSDRINVSERTMQRRLFSEETSYNQIVDDWRFKRAIGMLEGACSLQEISERLGYQKKQNFHRSFKRWTGVSPMEYKATAI